MIVELPSAIHVQVVAWAIRDRMPHLHPVVDENIFSLKLETNIIFPEIICAVINSA